MKKLLSSLPLWVFALCSVVPSTVYAEDCESRSGQEKQQCLDRIAKYSENVIFGLKQEFASRGDSSPLDHHATNSLATFEAFNPASGNFSMGLGRGSVENRMQGHVLADMNSLLGGTISQPSKNRLAGLAEFDVSFTREEDQRSESVQRYGLGIMNARGDRQRALIFGKTSGTAARNLTGPMSWVDENRDAYFVHVGQNTLKYGLEATCDVLNSMSAKGGGVIKDANGVVIDVPIDTIRKRSASPVCSMSASYNLNGRGGHQIARITGHYKTGNTLVSASQAVQYALEPKMLKTNEIGLDVTLPVSLLWGRGITRAASAK